MDGALKKKIDELPAEPGCYLMRDRAGAVVYVGKAASLRARVRSYFDRGGDDRHFVPLLDEVLGDVEVIVTRSEKEAVLLENELIKKHKPRFNVRLRDDKDFIVLRLDERHPYPRLEVTRARQRKDDGARYFGPYSSAGSIRETLRVVNRWFQLRTCSDHVFDHRKRPCILYQIHRCPAPCVYEVPEVEYRESVADAVAFLEGKESELLPRLRARMQDAAEGLRFEEAGRLRDQVQAVERSLEKQRVLMEDQADRDVVGLHREGPDLVVQLLSMRAGRLQESRAWPVAGTEFPEEELLSSFLALYYERAAPPEEVLVPFPPANGEAVAEVLSERRGRRVRLLVPQRGAKLDLLEAARRNAEQSFRGWREEGERREEALAALTRSLHLAREPRWMECYDISTFQGSLAVGSGVSVRDGQPDKANYRRYKVRGVLGQDDFAMLHEVLSRRLKRALAEGALPDLIVIDGGKGQLSAALAAAHDLGIATRPAPGNPGVPFVQMVALAKSRSLDPAALGTARVVGRRASPGAGIAAAAGRADRGYLQESARSPERVFVPNRKDPIVLRQNSAELYALVRLRDEAHRFAIEFHRKLRRARNLESVLEEIPGIGGGLRRALLRHFGSLKRVREAQAEEMAAVPGLGPARARLVYDFFHAPGAGEAPPRLEEAEVDAAIAEEESPPPGAGPGGTPPGGEHREP